MELKFICFTFLLAACRTAHAIAGGSKASIHQYPYQVAIDLFGNQSCSGALLTTQTVITANSCFDAGYIDVNDVTVRVGSEIREKGGEHARVLSFAKHPSVDLVLLYLDGEVFLRPEVQTVPLAKRGLAQGDILMISGYGNLGADGDEGDGTLRAASLPVLDTAICNYDYDDDDGDVTCAGGSGAGMCGRRDIGSPLVNWLGELAGLATSSEGCGGAGWPTVFTDLTDAGVQRWIADNADGPQPTSEPDSNSH